MQYEPTIETFTPSRDVRRIFHINDRVQIQIDNKTYRSRIEDVGPEHIIVATPNLRDDLVKIVPGQMVVLSIIAQESLHEFGFTAYKGFPGRVPTLILADPQYFGKVERRQYPRTKAAIPIQYRLARAPGPWEDELTDDIGGGGIRVPRKDTTMLAVGDMVEVRILLTTDRPIKTICRVLRVCYTAGMGGPCGYWAAEFVHIFPKDRADINRFVEKRNAELESDKNRIIKA